MTVFARPGLLLRDPHGGVEDVASMRAAGFEWIMVNVGDHAPEAWEAIVRPRALAAGVVCGPWARTQAADGSFAYDRCVSLLNTAERWGSPVLVNSENELKGSGDTITSWLAEELAGRDAALSMEAWPFDNVYWVPLADVPVLPQIFPEAGITDATGPRDAWHAYGIRCVYPTFASYGGRRPSDYRLAAPYSIYTADDCGQDYASWAPTSGDWSGCVAPEPEPPTNGGEVAAMGRGAATSADLAFEYWYQSTAKPDAWRRDNPGEWQAISAYREAPVGAVPPTGIRTQTGKMLLELVEARRYAEGSHA